MAHNLNFHTSDCHKLQLGKEKKANSVIVENNPLKEQKNLRKAWFNGNAFCNMLSLFCRLQKITRGREKSNYCKEQSFCESIIMIYTRHLLQHVLVEKNRCYFSE